MANQQAQKPQESTPEKVETAYVEYVGGADVRKISRAQWKAAGVEDQADALWDLSNLHRVKVSDLNADALTVLAKDPGFKVPKG